MSFRLHRGPKLLTIFHDASSSTSQQVLNDLRARARAPAIYQGGVQAPSSHAGTNDDSNPTSSSSSSSAPVRQYLDEASSAPINTEDALYELDVIDRRKATPDQWRTVGSYLRRGRPSQVEALKDETGPIVVNWDDGEATQTVEGVQRMIEKLEKESGRGGGRGASQRQSSTTDRGGSSSCTVI